MLLIFILPKRLSFIDKASVKNLKFLANIPKVSIVLCFSFRLERCIINPTSLSLRMLIQKEQSYGLKNVTWDRYMECVVIN